MKEYKIIEFRKAKTPYEEIEKALSDLSSEGWETVGFDVDMTADIRGKVVVLLVRDKTPTD